MHRSAANAHISQLFRYLHLHIYVYTVQTPGHSPVQPPIHPSSLSSFLSLTTIFSFLSLLLSSPSRHTPPPAPIQRKSPVSHAAHRVLIHTITSFSKSTTLRSTSRVTQPRISASGPSEASLVHLQGVKGLSMFAELEFESLFTASR